MVQEGVQWFGVTYSTTIHVGNSAAVVSANVKAIVATGETFTATITMKNDGGTIWTNTGATPYLPEPAETNRLKVLVAGRRSGRSRSRLRRPHRRFTEKGHDVTCLYLTRGEAGIPGKTAREAADIRTAEAETACEILKARDYSRANLTAYRGDGGTPRGIQ